MLDTQHWKVVYVLHTHPYAFPKHPVPEDEKVSPMGRFNQHTHRMNIQEVDRAFYIMHPVNDEEM